MDRVDITVVDTEQRVREMHKLLVEYQNEANAFTRSLLAAAIFQQIRTAFLEIS